jgi:hypothetical protein
MKISQNKSLIKEIAPGVIVIGNNPFNPLLKLDDIARKADILGEGVLVEGALSDISGESLSYNSADIQQATFNNRPTVQGVSVMLSGDMDFSISEINGEIYSLNTRIGAEETLRVDGVSSLDTRIGAEETLRVDGVSSLDTRVGAEEALNSNRFTSVDERISDLPTGGGTGLTEEEVRAIAFKAAIIFG